MSGCALCMILCIDVVVERVHARVSANLLPPSLLVKASLFASAFSPGLVAEKGTAPL